MGGYSPGGLYLPTFGPLSSFDRHALGPGLGAFNSQGVAGVAWPLANLALFIPVEVTEAIVLTGIYWATGGTAGGNLDIGLYNEDGTKVVSHGTVARGTVNSLNSSFALTDTTVGPGRYFMAMSADSTNIYNAAVPAAGLLEALGVCEMQTAFVLPSPATLVRTTRAYAPIFGFLIGGAVAP